MKKLTWEEAEQMVTAIDERRLFHADEISKYVESTGKINSNEDLVLLLTCMVEKDDGPNFYLEEKLVDCASKNEEYLNLILKAARHKQHFYSLSALIKVGNTNQDVSDFLYDKLGKIDEEVVAVGVGQLLGGVGQVNPKKLFKIIESSKTPTFNEKISYTISLDLTKRKHHIQNRFIHLLIAYSQSDNNSLRYRATVTLLTTFNDTPKVQHHLCSLAKSSDDMKKILVGSITVVTKHNEDFSLKLLKVCSYTEDLRLIQSVALNLGYLAPKFPVEVLKIIRRWSKKQGFSLYQWPGWAAEQAGKGDIAKITSFLESWIRVEKNLITWRFHIPGLVGEIYEGKEDELIRLVHSIDYRQKSKADLTVDILKEFLSQGYGETRRSDVFLQKCNDVLMEIAEIHRLQTEIDSSISSPYMKTMALIDAIEADQKVPDQDVIRKNLKHFPKLVSFLGAKNIEDLIKNRTNHPLVKILARVKPSKKGIEKLSKRIDEEKEPWKKGFLIRAITNRFYPASYVLELEAALFFFDPNEQGMARIRDGLLNQDEFFDTIAELSLAARFKKRFPVTLQPKFSDNKLDMKVTINGKDHLIEVYAPDTDIRLKYVKKVHSMGNRIKDVLLEKINTQLKAVESQNLPVLVVVDKSRSMDVDEIEITDSLFGSLQYTLLFDKEKGTVVKEYPSRKNDSVSEVSPYGKVLSGIVLLKRDMDDGDFKMKANGKIILNPNASIKISDDVVSEIEKTLFGVALF